MKRTILVLILAGIMALAACGPREVAGPTEAQIASLTATAAVMQSALPVDLPIPADATNLRIAANNTYISFEVLGPLDSVIEYYKTSLAEQGWEKMNNSNEAPVGEAVTLLRSKPDRNLSVTIQSIPKSDNVRVLITVINK